MANKSTSEVVASTQAWSFVKFSCGDRHRYRLREKTRYDLGKATGVPELEAPGSCHLRLSDRGPQIPLAEFYSINGIVWDVESKDWREALPHLDPRKTFLLVHWKDHDPSWERASDFQRFVPGRDYGEFLQDLAHKQEEQFEDKSAAEIEAYLDQA